MRKHPEANTAGIQLLEVNQRLAVQLMNLTSCSHITTTQTLGQKQTASSLTKSTNSLFLEALSKRTQSNALFAPLHCRSIV